MRVDSVKYLKGQVSLTKHYHDAHQLLFVTDGKISVIVDGEEEILTRGSLLILSKFEEHSVSVLSGNYSRYRVLISSEPSGAVDDNYHLSSVLVNRTKNFRHVIDLDHVVHAFEKIFESMLYEFKEKHDLYEEQLDLLFKMLLIELYRVSPEIFVQEAKANTSVVEKIQKRFENEYYEDFSLTALSTEYHVSASHLAHIFKSVTGYAPIDYLTTCRLTAAKNFLATTDKPIKEIVSSCGFGDESNFSRMFKSKIGMTPSAYRKEYTL